MPHLLHSDEYDELNEYEELDDYDEGVDTLDSEELEYDEEERY